jgi:chorismate dehydratase
MLRFGCHDFINSLPILRGLKRATGDFSLTLGKPRAIAEMLQKRLLDIAIVPAIEYLRNSDYAIVPDVCIAASGRVESVNLYHRKPLSEIRRIALDSSSLTSVFLTKVIMGKCFKARPQYVTASSTRMEELGENAADAVLVIGDEALGPVPAGFEALDLAEQWRRMSGLPFVFAVCCARRETEIMGFDRILHESLMDGLSHVLEIAGEAARETGLPRERVEEYLMRNLHFTLGKEEMEGLRRFYAETVAAGLWPRERELEFHS